MASNQQKNLFCTIQEVMNAQTFVIPSGRSIAAFYLLVVFLLTSLSLNAQVLMPDNFYVRENVQNKRAVPYVHEREADIMWSKRVWRTIDLREKFNHPLYFPETQINNRRSLFDVVKRAIIAGDLTPFDNPALDDEFTTPMSPATTRELFNAGYWTVQEDPNEPGTYDSVWVAQPLESRMIKAWWVKEDWFWDRQRGVMDVRIVGICPLQEKLAPAVEGSSESGEVIGYKPLFWLHFDQLRPMLAKEECYNTRNDAQRLSYDDVFRKRMFSSFVHKESNVFDRSVVSYASGLEVQFESERIKNDIFINEHDYWHL
jgi:gliding motility associated protien GldN